MTFGKVLVTGISLSWRAVVDVRPESGVYMANQDYRELEFDVFFDFQCPFVNAAAIWLHNVEGELGYPLRATWRAFPLEQVNSKNGDDWKLWEQPDSYVSRGLPGFRGAIAARQQGQDRYHDFVWELLNLRHQEGQDLASDATIIEAATRAGLDLDRFAVDRASREHLGVIGADYGEARDTHGVFGTPTFVFPNGGSAYLKLQLGNVPAGAEAVTFFEQFVGITRDMPKVVEIKRPTPPQT